MGGGVIGWSRVACEGVLPELVAPPGWSKEERGDMWVVKALDDSPPNAYEVVVQEVLEGDRSMFLGTEVSTTITRQQAGRGGGG